VGTHFALLTIGAHRVEPLLTLDPDLGQLLSPERAGAAAREIPVAVTPLRPGSWRPEQHGPPSPADFGLLLLGGAILRDIVVHGTPSAELFGAGDVIRTWQSEGPSALQHPRARWSVLCPSSVAELRGPTARALRAYPEITTMLVDRLHARAERLAIAQAISQITGVEMRVDALMQQLAERWGRVHPEGIRVPLVLSHRLIGALVGARRPTVSTALTHLAERDRVRRQPDGTWLLARDPGPPPALEDQLRAPYRVLAPA
jgi:CRP/FNR family cyclic AMP-dependent transcriptional regulator